LTRYLTVNKDSGLKSSDPIDSGSSEAEKPTENQSRSPPPTFDEVEKYAEKMAGGDTVMDPKGDDTLLLENAGTFFLHCFLSDFIDNGLPFSLFLCFFSGFNFDHHDWQGKRPTLISTKPRHHLDWALILRRWNLVCITN
jgi:hypothetical protein